MRSPKNLYQRHRPFLHQSVYPPSPQKSPSSVVKRKSGAIGAVAFFDASPTHPGAQVSK
ncbi:MAG: hypothetical protein LBV28_03135 [Puniceicoccales bacterium]|nr:hypothetical protein [Puniceicoccales bacterium]